MSIPDNMESVSIEHLTTTIAVLSYIKVHGLDGLLTQPSKAKTNGYKRAAHKIVSIINDLNKQYYKAKLSLKMKMKVLDQKKVSKCGLLQLRNSRMGMATSGTFHQLLSAAKPAQRLKGIEPLVDKDEKKTSTKQKLSAPMKKTSARITRSKRCYVCKKMFNTLHHFYDQLCTSCGDTNFQKRHQEIPLHDNQVSLVTGGRVKIGYQIALKLLRASNGGDVFVTTRFPNDAAARYSLEDDYDTWKHRLRIFGLDFRNIAALETFTRMLNKDLDRLDIVINNAAQTIQRPNAYFEHLRPKEESTTIRWPTVLSQDTPLIFDQKAIVASPTLPFNKQKRVQSIVNKDTKTSTAIIQERSQTEVIFPIGQFDVDHQQIDRRSVNSWKLRHHQIQTQELAETMLINMMAPFILMRDLKELMSKTSKTSTSKGTFIINVSSMEGSFTRTKTTNHPHTNCAKAYLDMMTRTSASEYYTHSSIFVNSVDTGWVTNENPRPEDSQFIAPIDEVDAAARILDPIVVALSAGTFHYGRFFKDYKPLHTLNERVDLSP